MGAEVSLLQINNPPLLIPSLPHSLICLFVQGGTSWTINWLQFDNSYYLNLLETTSNEDLLQLETDKALVLDPDFKKYVDLYAGDQNAFFSDYAEVS